MKANQVWVWVLGVALMACGQPSSAPVLVDAAPIADDAQRAEPVIARPHVNVNPPKASPDTRSAEQIAAAACTTPTGEWRCAAKRPKVFAASGSTPIIPASWTIGQWDIDPANSITCASDSNTGTSATCVGGCTGSVCPSGQGPLLTYAELAVHRWGFSGVCPAPNLAQNTTVTFLSAQSGNSDPIPWCPNLYGTGVYSSIQCAAASATSAVFTLNLAKSRAAGTNRLLSGSFSVGAPAAGIEIQNTTAAKSSIAFVHTTAGGSNWNLTQPLAPLTVPTTTLGPTEVDTWASTDTVQVFSPIAIDLVRYSPIVSTQAAAGNNFGYLYNCTILDPGGVGNDPVFLSGPVQPMQNVFQRGISYISAQGVVAGAILNDPAFQNNYYLGGIWTSATVDTVFVIGGGTNNFTSSFGEASFDGDYVAGGFGFNFLAGGNFGIGFVYLDSSSSVSGGSVLRFATNFYGGHVLYGNTGKTVSFKDHSYGNMASGTYTNGWTAPTLITGVTMNNATSACSQSGANNPDVINCGITTTVAHLDAAQGLAGFGGTAFQPGGSSVSTNP